ncbi:transposase [Paraprevotella clara]|uniref:transposase n=1 Tax=Paraprevotella clara TaxID=454154 RepID=UPI00300E9BA3
MRYSDTLEEAGIPVKTDIFLNADAGFDSEDFRNQCLSHGVFPNVCFNKRNGGYDRNELLIKELYRKRYTIERTNAWMDSFTAVYLSDMTQH